nr:MAG TPA: hypothetical protein [Caudoviricetes sp.]
MHFCSLSCILYTVHDSEQNIFNSKLQFQKVR